MSPGRGPLPSAPESQEGEEGRAGPYLLAGGRRAAEAGVAAVRAVRHGRGLPGSARSPGASGLSCHRPASLPDRSPRAGSPPRSAGPSSARLAAASDPGVFLALGCGGSAPHRDMSLALGLAPSLTLVVSGNSRWKSHGRKLKLEVKLRENTYLGKDPQNYVKEKKERKKKDTQNPRYLPTV